MKESRDLLFGVLNLGLWATLYTLGFATRVHILAIGILLACYCFVAWVEKSGLFFKSLALFFAHGLFSYSFIGFTLPLGTGLLAGLLSLAFSLSYFFQWHAFRLKSFQLFSKRRDKILSGIFSATVFGIFFSLFSPNFPAITKELIAQVPNLLATSWERAAIFCAVYALVLFATPNIRIGKK